MPIVPGRARTAVRETFLAVMRSILPALLQTRVILPPSHFGRLRPDPAGRVQGLIGSLGLPQHIAAYGIGEPELRKAAGELAAKYSAEDLLKIYVAAL